ncbi:glutamine synthetase family protein [Martelella sp. HB161492]|uniref:glutamine synthetase family protein n=1 Tax=Martelella sp. HB161492 TaxID=2720726 RepID=UPI0015917ED8|nr:glutamine synthetase family protein [Martelella sp. HB161492]
MTYEALTGIVTTDLTAITRGRFVAAKVLEKVEKNGVGWLQANLSLTPFGTIADPNPFGSTGDLKLMPDMTARFRTENSGAEIPFDMICGDLVELDGSPWACCCRTILKQALALLEAETGYRLKVAFEHEFQLLGADLPFGHVLSFAGLRRAGGFAPQLMAALDEAGVEPEVVIAEYGLDQFEITHAACDGLAAADRAVAIREITREIAQNSGFRASFAPKTALSAVGNGVHIHFSLIDRAGYPASFDPFGPACMSEAQGHFAAGILAHMRALVALTASSPASFFRLKPHSWSASYTWLGDKDREASLRACPVSTAGGRNPAKQFNLEYRAADATANPYLALAALVLAGLEGCKKRLGPPPVFSGDPAALSDAEREEAGLYRLPENLPDALAALAADPVVCGFFDPLFIETLIGEKQAELIACEDFDDDTVCTLYRDAY